MTIAVQPVAAYEREQQLARRYKTRKVAPAVLDALMARGTDVTARWLYLALYRIGHRNRREWPTREALAVIAGLSVSQVKRGLVALRAAKMLDSWTGYGGKPNVYRLVYPVDWPAERDAKSRAAAAVAALAPDVENAAFLSGKSEAKHFDTRLEEHSTSAPQSATAEATAKGRSAETAANAGCFDTGLLDLPTQHDNQAART